MTIIVLDQAKLNWLMDNRIYFQYKGDMRLKINQTLRWLPQVEVEPYTAYLSGDVLWTMGAFSYSWSFLPSDIKLGRYCSIAGGVKVIGGNHPLDRLSTSSFTYDAHFDMLNQVIEDFQAIEDFEVGFKAVAFTAHHKTAPVIKHDVWIGGDVLLGRGITIGTGGLLLRQVLW